MRHQGKVEPVPGGLVATGPLVQVTLGPHPSLTLQMQAAGQAVPNVATKLMVDTGAQRTVIERTLAEQLGLTPIRFEPMVGVSQVPEMCPVYLASVTIGMRSATEEAMVTFAAEIIGMASPPSPQQHRGLLGRDFLMHVDQFVYNGPLGSFEIIGKKGQSNPKNAALSFAEKSALKAKRKAERTARKKSR